MAIVRRIVTVPSVLLVIDRGVVQEIISDTAIRVRVVDLDVLQRQVAEGPDSGWEPPDEVLETPEAVEQRATELLLGLSE